MAAYKLVLIRHGESNWNQENRFCGWFDADLSETGVQEAKRGGQALKGQKVIYSIGTMGSPFSPWLGKSPACMQARARPERMMCRMMHLQGEDSGSSAAELQHTVIIINNIISYCCFNCKSKRISLCDSSLTIDDSTDGENSQS